jgi:hypothetical protein
MTSLESLIAALPEGEFPATREYKRVCDLRSSVDDIYADAAIAELLAKLGEEQTAISHAVYLLENSRSYEAMTFLRARAAAPEAEPPCDDYDINTDNEESESGCECQHYETDARCPEQDGCHPAPEPEEGWMSDDWIPPEGMGDQPDPTDEPLNEGGKS